MIANLVGNAIDATSRGGRLIVRARRSENWNHGPQQQGVRITVADTGSGIEDDARHRIFEAFFTTKDETGNRAGIVGEPRDHPETSRVSAHAQPAGIQRRAGRGRFFNFFPG